MGSRGSCSTWSANFAPGTAIDEQIGDVLLEMMAPLTLEVALGVQEELRSRLEEVTRLRQQQVERAQYEAQIARHRYMQVDPANRLVADSLEAEWNEKLRVLREAEEQYEAGCRADRAALDAEKRRRVLSLATDFPRLWRDPGTPQQERKRMVRLLMPYALHLYQVRCGGLTELQAELARVEALGGEGCPCNVPVILESPAVGPRR